MLIKNVIISQPTKLTKIEKSKARPILPILNTSRIVPTQRAINNDFISYKNSPIQINKHSV